VSSIVRVSSVVLVTTNSGCPLPSARWASIGAGGALGSDGGGAGTGAATGAGSAAGGATGTSLAELLFPPEHVCTPTPTNTLPYPKLAPARPTS
jgi:hypothetical protein